MKDNLTETQQIIRDVGRIATWTVDHETGAIVSGSYDLLCERQAMVPHSHALLDMLWRDELLEIAARHGRVSVHIKKPSHVVLRDACERGMTGLEVRRAVCRALRARGAFDKMSDPPVRDGEKIAPGPTETGVDGQIGLGGKKENPAHNPVCRGLGGTT